MDQDPDYPNNTNGKFQTFTFDDIPIHQYRNQIHEMTGWINTDLQKLGDTIHQILTDFVSHFIGYL